MPIQKFISKGKVPVKIYTEDIGHETLQPLYNMSQLPFIHHHIAVMPDVHLGKGATVGSVNCHHNYVAIERHFGEQVYVTRKGAIRAGEDELGIIPGSMGAKSYIVRGKGNPQSFSSCSHGAGRRMSRTAAKRKFNQDDLEAQTQGIECRKDKDVVDEIPSAYKDIDEVMENQNDLVEIVHTLRQLVCVKG